MMIGYTTIDAYHHSSCGFESRSCGSVLVQDYVIKFVSDLWQVGSTPYHLGNSTFYIDVFLVGVNLFIKERSCALEYTKRGGKSSCLLSNSNPGNWWIILHVQCWGYGFN
jgi:hypothetical protein